MHLTNSSTRTFYSMCKPRAFKKSPVSADVRSMENIDSQATVNYSVSSEKVDLSGKDLLSVFGKERNEVFSLIGLSISDGSVKPISVPAEKVTSMAGAVADEVHEWPNANLGASFRSLSLHFKVGLLIALEWNFSLKDFIPKKMPWYKKWI